MNLDSLISTSTIRSDTLTATLNRHNYPTAHQTMPQRSPFAIQELLGLSESSRQPSNTNSASSGNTSGPNGNNGLSAVPPSLYNQINNQSTPSDHQHQMQMAASRMAYFNAHAAAFNVAAAFLPGAHMSGAGAGPLGLHHQSASKCFVTTFVSICLENYNKYNKLHCVLNFFFHQINFIGNR
jgi:hypothetical protein